jgi:hypothetical protein
VVARQGTITVQGSANPVMRMSPFIGEPYCATTETDVSHTLADGTHIERKLHTTKTSRDSQGRTGEENFVPGNMATVVPGGPTNILIRDPVAGLACFLFPRDHTARRSELIVSPAPANRPPSAQSPASGRDRSPDVEDLGTQTMEGLLVEGKRGTITIPAGVQGNDRPMQVATERWFISELQLVTLTKTSNPESGEQTSRVTNLERNEPDPALFQVPADYTIEQH